MGPIMRAVREDWGIITPDTSHCSNQMRRRGSVRTRRIASITVIILVW
jgi:hypothetical protein